MKIPISCVITFVCFGMITLHAQTRKVAKFGEPTLKERGLKKYDKDPNAAGVVLFESGHYYIEEIDNYLRLVKEIHRRIKVFDAKRFTESEVFIPYYHDNTSSEKITKLQAITHNGKLKKYVTDDAIFDTDETNRWKVKRFTFPNVQDGSILEYTYRIESPYFSSLNGWEFQGELPKIYSEFESKIPGNFSYKRVLIGSEKLDINEASIEKNCFHLDGYQQSADCEIGLYAMTDVPAFVEESYMLSKKNYMSSLRYELVETVDLEGSKTRYTKEWKDVDREFKNDKDIGRQLKKNNFFEDKLPQGITEIPNSVEKAKAIYSFIQDHYTWNGNYRIFSDIRVKDAFEKGTANNTEINVSLVNALTAAGFDAHLVFISTRENGLPTPNYPVMTDFNHTIVQLKINNEDYMLDATSKHAPFGIVPFMDLNVKGRVMDFKKGSYWTNIEPFKKNIYYVNSQLTAQPDGSFTGKVNEMSQGYIALENREELAANTVGGLAAYKQNESKVSEIENIVVKNQNELDEPFTISYDIELDPETVGTKHLLNPYFFDTYFSENPFQYETRNYPIDFGFPIATTYVVTIDLANVYAVGQLPENKMVKLPEDAGDCKVVYASENGKIMIRFTMNLNAYRFQAEGYPMLKSFFETMIKFQNQEPILLTEI
ncbi:MAG: DUF3857 and transglutaminase domain-containing protein [Flavobacteriales bacterium]|jgi:hypothetical protein|nr:DUF3857 and transglutaminase domain-containing protein [Flavobacteriales bacterium]